MTQRDPQALARLSRELAPAASRVCAARAAVRANRALVKAVRAVPKATLWLASPLLVIGFFASVPFWAGPLLLVLLTALLFVRDRGRVPPAEAPLVDGALACDRAHDNQDRLTTACELAGAAPRGDGMAEALAHAAIDDGVQSLQRVRAERLQLPVANERPNWLLAVACVVGLGLLPLLLPTRDAGPREGNPVADAGRAITRAEDAARRSADAEMRPPVEPLAEKRVDDTKERRDAGEKGGTPPPPKPSAPAPAVPAASGQGRSGSDAAGDSTQSGAPKAAPAGNPGGGQSGGGQGSAASGTPEPSATPPTPKVPPKPKAPKPQKVQPQQDGKPSESAVAPSGPSRGSGRMSAVGNKRNDLNRGQERDDDPEVEDEEVEDLTDEQEQRGGVMPMRRGDNRPAARELSISGDGPPDQGRGGPTPPKKARGTASLVLGLRLPDSVRGQPNPGTAKTSLEQIPPRPSAADVGLARAVAAGRPTTPQSQRPVTPFLALQQAYHALLRARDSSTPSAPSSPSADSPENRR